MIALVRYTTVGCVRVWRTYWVVRYVAPLAAVAIPCGGYVAGRPLPPAPMPYVEPALLPPDVAYFPPGYAGYEQPHPAGAFPPRWSREVPDVGGAAPGPFAGGAATPNDSSVGPCCIQPRTTDHLYSPPAPLLPTPGFPVVAPVAPVAVPEPASWWLFALAVTWLLAFRARGHAIPLGLAFGATFWTAVWWAF